MFRLGGSRNLLTVVHGAIPFFQTRVWQAGILAGAMMVGAYRPFFTEWACGLKAWQGLGQVWLACISLDRIFCSQNVKRGKSLFDCFRIIADYTTRKTFPWKTHYTRSPLQCCSVLFQIFNTLRALHRLFPVLHILWQGSMISRYLCIKFQLVFSRCNLHNAFIPCQICVLFIGWIARTFQVFISLFSFYVSQ